MSFNTANGNAAFTYATQGEARTAKRLIKAALDKGYAISVFDGEVWVIKQSRDAKVIEAAMNSTDCDTLRFRDNGNIIGAALIIYGNAENGSELIADYTDNEAMEALYRAANA